METRRLSPQAVQAVAHQCLAAHGCDEANAAAVASVIARAEADGCHAHGLMRLAGYVAALDSGKVNGSASPTITTLAPSVIQVEGNGGFAPLAHAASRDALIDAARTQGIAALSLVNVHHFAALWAEIEPVAEAGLSAFAFTSYKPAVIPAGGNQALYGTNPMAFGWPRADAPPLIFDQASSVVARGEVMLAAREGHDMADGVGVDADGNPTNNPNDILKGALLAFGGHKGASIAMMVELLAGSLLGECFSFEAAERDNNDGGPPRGGELMIALSPALFGDAEGWAGHSEALFDRISAQPGARLPADRRYENRRRAAADGIPVPSSVLEQVASLGASIPEANA